MSDNSNNLSPNLPSGDLSQIYQKEPKHRWSKEHKFSDFIVYVDESGDHSVTNIDERYPVFVLAFCVFYKTHYVDKIVPALETFKFQHFGHDLVILHESDIRKETGIFRFENRSEKEKFMRSLGGIIEDYNFILISSVIDKKRFKEEGSTGDDQNIYHFALQHCLETLADFIEEKGQSDRKTHIVVEKRGRTEDRALELEFRRICDGNNRKSATLPFEVIFGDKQANSSGLQLADLVARPIGMHFLRPEQPNRTWQILEKKFFCQGGRDCVGEGYEGRGLKIHPTQKSEKPR